MLFQIFSLILHFAAGLLAGTCLLRLYLHLLRINLARSHHPLAPFVFTLTNWLVLPVRRVMPAIGRLDTASLLATYAVLLLKQALLAWVSMASMAWWPHVLVLAGFELVGVALSGLMWLVLLHVLMSWMKNSSDTAYLFAQLVHPLLYPLQRVLPHMGGVDLSPIAVLLLIQIAEIVLHGLRAAWLF